MNIFNKGPVTKEPDVYNFSVGPARPIHNSESNDRIFLHFHVVGLRDAFIHVYFHNISENSFENIQDSSIV